MPEILILLAVALALMALVLSAMVLFRSRNLALRQEGILHEIEEIRAAQRRVLEQSHGLAHRLKVLTEKIAVKGGAGPGAKTEPQATMPKAAKEDVLFLARQGLSAEKIARDLNIPRGEVELIMDLDRFSSKS